MTLIVDPLGRRDDGEALTVKDLREWLEAVEDVDAGGTNIPDDAVLAVQVKGGSNQFTQAPGFMSITGIRTVADLGSDGKVLR